MFSYTDDSLTTDDYADLETPISTRNYFMAIRNLDEIRNSLRRDSGWHPLVISEMCLFSLFSAFVLNINSS